MSHISLVHMHDNTLVFAVTLKSEISVRAYTLFLHTCSGPECEKVAFSVFNLVTLLQLNIAS